MRRPALPARSPAPRLAPVLAPVLVEARRPGTGGTGAGTTTGTRGTATGGAGAGGTGAGTATGAGRTATGAGTNNNSNSTATGAGVTGGTPSAPNRVEDPLVRAVVGNLADNRFQVTVLPQNQSRPAAATRTTANAFYLQPFTSASKTTVNFTGNELFLAYFVNATLQQQFNYYDQQFLAQGFQRVNSDANNTTAGASTRELKAVYRRGNSGGTVGVTVDEFGGTNGYRLRANFDDFVKTLSILGSVASNFVSDSECLNWVGTGNTCKKICHFLPLVIGE
jgi:hypothetical protein